MTTRFAVGAAALLLVGQGSDVNELIRQDQKRLQGKWQVVAAENKGEKVLSKDIADLFLLIEDDTIQGLENKKTQVKYMFRLMPDKKPKRIDFTYTTGPKKGRTDRGIYQFQGERLTFCIQEDEMQLRPTEFATNPDSALSLVVLERVK
jgi:uncharacterized protein (TIGR03067 family)